MRATLACLGHPAVARALVLLNAEQVATWNDESDRWRRAHTAFQRVSSRWPGLRDALPRHFDVLADYDDHDIDRLEAVMTWIERNPRSNLYPRQLPIGGVDTKWIDDKRGLLSDLVAGLSGSTSLQADFYDICGLKAPPFLLRMRILDAHLCGAVGGLSDVTAPIQEIANLAFEVETVYIVENLQTGLCFRDVPGGVVIMGLGNSVGTVKQLPWVTKARVILYWGDVDTHGFAILNGLRRELPGVISVLMDAETLLAHRHLWTTEQKQFGLSDLSNLSESERVVYYQLKNHTWGVNVRLEQERIAWPHACSVLQSAVNAAATAINDTVIS